MPPISPTAISHALDKERAHRARRQPRAVNGHPAFGAGSSASSWQCLQLVETLFQGLCNQPSRQASRQAAHETVKRGVIWHARQLQSVAQGRMIANVCLGLAKCPILKPHDAQHGQQLRLGKYMLGVSIRVTRQRRTRHVQGDPCKLDQAHILHQLLLWL